METVFPLGFTKMSGTGNDFIIIDNRGRKVAHQDQPELTRRVCRRMFSAGADGVIFVENAETADFCWQFYNADGSVAEMCGNGARCVARFAYVNGIAGQKMRFETVAGTIEAEVCEDDTVRIRMTEPRDLKEDLPLVIDGEERPATFINTGVPHTVLFVNEDVPVTQWGRAVRFHELFQPEGTNVNFVRILGPHQIEARTYERGVEDETRACGTGAVASAIIASIKKGVASPVDVTTSGGEQLTIEFDRSMANRVENVYLKGPARIVYTGELTAESLL